MMYYILAFYELDRAYGGPQDGGWWFDTGTRVRLHRLERNEERANAFAARANRLLDRLQQHKRSVGSVGYRGGRHLMCVFEHSAPRDFPQTAPAYE